jgi:hypothetical protein
MLINHYRARALIASTTIATLVAVGVLDGEFGDQHTIERRRGKFGFSIFVSSIDAGNPHHSVQAGLIALASIGVLGLFIFRQGSKGSWDRMMSVGCSAFLIWTTIILPNLVRQFLLQSTVREKSSKFSAQVQPPKASARTDMNMEWVKHVKMTNHHGPRVIVAQTCGMGKYEELLKETRLVNEKYARAHGYDYLAVIGLYSGTTEWHSTFNKAFVLESVLRAETHYDLLFYLDADAMVINPASRCRVQLPSITITGPQPIFCWPRTGYMTILLSVHQQISTRVCSCGI